ncbi:MAG TPA: AraC family transcriptional regulator [Puia sp.]|jgi:AraC-like DNA-binding protein|nr:AraC family transcriptional regulator [Puia sp.]HVV03749.1 AraC family transcriptional regulator [Puia sp.]
MEVTFYDKHGTPTEIEFSDVSFMPSHRPQVREVHKKLDLSFMTGEATQLSARDIDVIYGGMLMKETRTAHFNSFSEPEHIEMHFTLAGEGCLNNLSSGKQYRFSGNEQNIHYTPQFIGSSHYEQGSVHRFFEVRLNKSFFLSLAEDSSPMLMEFAEKVANDKPVEVSAENLPISLAMHRCIHEIMHLEMTDGLKGLFLQSKCIELLTLQAQAHELAVDKGSRICKTRQDKERIYFARDYLVHHAACPPSLTELARVAGLNEFKLKKGFKEVFDTSVFGYLNNFRLNEAKNSLLSGVAIKEVAEQLGYSSVQHFTRAFKEEFGVTPGRVEG